MLLAYTRARLARQEGQALVEYALILALIAALLVGSLTFLHDQLASIFSDIGSKL